MYPTNRYPFNVRSFFTDRETKEIPGSGLQLWRGYFQSVRPAIGRMIINVDISTGAMYQAGSLLDLCLDFLGKKHGQEDVLAPGPGGLTDRDRLRLQKFIAGIRVVTEHRGSDGNSREIPRVLKKLTAVSARNLYFNLKEGGSMSVAEYFQKLRNKPLRFPNAICVEVLLLFLLLVFLIHKNVGRLWGSDTFGVMLGQVRSNHEEASVSRQN
jgi:eukaryotic translation initiation factor 2C